MSFEDTHFESVSNDDLRWSEGGRESWRCAMRIILGRASAISNGVEIWYDPRT